MFASLNLYKYYALEKSFNIYDGFVFPNTTWWSKINNYFSATGINTKDSHGYALNIFLKQSIDLSIQGFEVAKSTEIVTRIYLQLKNKKYFPSIDTQKLTQFCCNDQLDKGLQQVCNGKSCYISSICTGIRIEAHKLQYCSTITSFFHVWKCVVTRHE